MTQCLVGPPKYKKRYILKLNHLEYMKYHGFNGNPSWIMKNEGVWGSPKEQLDTHENLSWDVGGEGRARYAK